MVIANLGFFTQILMVFHIKSTNQRLCNGLSIEDFVHYGPFGFLQPNPIDIKMIVKILGFSCEFSMILHSNSTNRRYTTTLRLMTVAITLEQRSENVSLFSNENPRESFRDRAPLLL